MTIVFQEHLLHAISTSRHYCKQTENAELNLLSPISGKPIPNGLEATTHKNTLKPATIVCRYIISTSQQFSCTDIGHLQPNVMPNMLQAAI